MGFTMTEIDYILNGKRGSSRKKSPVSDSFLGTMNYKPIVLGKSFSPDVGLFPKQTASTGSDLVSLGVNNSPKKRALTNDSFLRSMVYSSKSGPVKKSASNDAFLRSMVYSSKSGPVRKSASNDAFLRGMVNDFNPKSSKSVRTNDSYLKSVMSECMPNVHNKSKSKSSYYPNIKSIVGGKYNPDQFVTDMKTEPQKKFLKKTAIGTGRSHERFWDSDGDGVINGMDCFWEDPTQHGFGDRLRNWKQGFKSDVQLEEKKKARYDEELGPKKIEMAEKQGSIGLIEQKGQSILDDGQLPIDKQDSKLDRIDNKIARKDADIAQVEADGILAENSIRDDAKKMKRLYDESKRLTLREKGLSNDNPDEELMTGYEIENEWDDAFEDWHTKRDLQREIPQRLKDDKKELVSKYWDALDERNRLKRELKQAKSQYDDANAPEIRELEKQIGEASRAAAQTQRKVDERDLSIQKLKDSDSFGKNVRALAPGFIGGPQKWVEEQARIDRKIDASNFKLADINKKIKSATDPAKKSKLMRERSLETAAQADLFNKKQKFAEKQTSYEKGESGPSGIVSNVGGFIGEKVSDVAKDVSRGFGRATGYAFVDKETRALRRGEDIGTVRDNWVTHSDGSQTLAYDLAPDIKKRVEEARRKLTPAQIAFLDKNEIKKTLKFDNKGNPVTVDGKQLTVTKGSMSPVDVARETLRMARDTERDRTLAKRREPIQAEQDRATMMYARVQQAQSAANLPNYELQRLGAERQLASVTSRQSIGRQGLTGIRDPSGNRFAEMSGRSMGSANLGYSPNGLLMGALPAKKRPVPDYMDAIAAQGIVGGPQIIQDDEEV